MTDNIMPEERMTVILGESERSPTKAPANALALALEAGSDPGSHALTLHGYFNIGVDMTGRYSGAFPSPVFVVAIFRKTGHLHIQTLTNQDEIPPQYQGAAAEPAITRADGASAAGISESGYFNVDLKAHLGLASDKGIYDVFLWVEDVLSDMASVEKPEAPFGGIGSTLFKRPASTAEIEPLPDEGELTLSTENREEELWFVGQSNTDPVTVVAYVLQTQEPAWMVLSAPKEEEEDKDEKANADEVEPSGLSFAFKASDLLPGIKSDDRILAVAVSGGRRTPLLDLTVSR